MRRSFGLTLIIFSLAGILLTYNQCIPGGKKSSLQFNAGDSTTLESNSQVFIPQGEGSASSVAAFEQTVHPITTQYCGSCHGSFQQPLHGSSDVQVAHDAVINAQKVNFNNIPNSRLVQKVAQGHNCWGDCNDNADEMTQAIQYWYDAAYSGTGATTVTLDGKKTNQTQTLNNIFGTNSNIMMNAEAASLSNGMIADETQEGINYITVPTGQGVSGNASPGASAAGRGHIYFNVPLGGVFRAFALVNAPAGSSDSVYFRVNNGSYNRWDIGTTNGFEWKEIKSWSILGNSQFTISLGTGSGIVEIQEREDGVQISKILLTKDLNITEQQVNDSGTRTLIFNLTSHFALTDALLKMDIENFDAYSYKVSNVRVEMSHGKLYIKDIKVLINDDYNPQHTTFTHVGTDPNEDDETLGKEITPSNGQVSEASMIMLKDQGVDVDRISLHFESLEFYPD